MKVGDSISFLNENKTGVLLAIQMSNATILDEYGFTQEVALSEIVLRDDSLYSKIPIKKKEESAKIKSKKKSTATRTLDLHFHLLVKNPNAFDAQTRLEIQKGKLLDMLQYCKKNPIKKLNIIHGIGDGILQEMVFEILEGFAGLEYEDHNIFHQSSGNVVVTFR